MEAASRSPGADVAGVSPIPMSHAVIRHHRTWRVDQAAASREDERRAPQNHLRAAVKCTGFSML